MKEQKDLHQNLMNDIPPQETKDIKIQQFKKGYFSKEHYLFGDNIFQMIIFSWISPLLQYGHKSTLEERAVPQLRPQHKPKIDFDKLSSSFQSAKKSKSEGWTLAKSIYKAFKKQIRLILLFSIIKTGLQMYSPILSHDVISYISSGQKTTGMSILYFFAIFMVTLLMALDTSYLFYYFGVLGFNLSNTLSLLVYNKSLRHPLITQKKFAISDIINYSQVDAQRMTFMGFQLVALLFTPIQIVVGMYLLYIYIGPSFLVGTGVMMALMLFTFVFTKISTKYNDYLLKAKDRRMKLTQEIMQIIKFIKINALQKYFFKKLNQKRQDQLSLIKTVNFYYVLTTFVYWLCPPLIVSATFLLYVKQGNQITAQKAFITIIIFNILQYPMRLFPTSISSLIQMWSSIKRIQKFLFSSEVDKQLVHYSDKKDQKYAVQISHGYFLWGKQKKSQQEKKKTIKKKSKRRRRRQSSDEQSQQQQLQTKIPTNSSLIDDPYSINAEDNLRQTHSDTSSVYLQRQTIIGLQSRAPKKPKSRYIKALQQINIKIPAKKVTMVIGDIGSGKSSLLFAMLNQMTPQPMRNPQIEINGQIAYAPQKPWIMTGTVKQNILFFNPYNQQRFKDVLRYACLMDDIKLFANGIDTQIGQKGVNLSGGQKARISLARTLYSNKDIYLLDDILSAVDVHVGKFLMEQTILGFLKQKTVIMPTHAVKYLQSADNIIIMKKGRVLASGPLKYVKDCEQFQNILASDNKHEQQQEQKIEKEQIAIKKLQRSFKQATISFTKKSLVKSFQQAALKQQNPQIQVEAVQEVVQQLIMPEDQNTGAVSKQVYFEYIKQNGGPIFIISVLLCLSLWTVLSTLSNIQIRYWCQDQNKSQFHLYLYLVFSISAALFSGLRALILVLSGVRQGRVIHKKIIKALLYTSITKFYNRVPMGRILNRLSKDLREVDQTIGFALGGTLVNIFCLIASLTMCIYGSSLWMMLPIIVSGYACLKFKDYYLKSQRQCVRLQNITNSPIVSGFTSAVNGVATIRAYHLQHEFLQHQISKIDVNKRMRISRSAMQSWYALRLTFLSFLVNMSAIGFCILGGNSSASIAGLLLTYSTVLSDDIINVAFSYASLQLKMISVERVSNFTKIQPELGYEKYCQKWRTKQQGSNLQAISQGRISFKNYCSRYRDGLPLVIKNINIEIDPGDKVGIVGRTGAGKSTLINCLLRILEPAQGQICIDGKNILEYNLKDLRSCMTMIEQQPTLMNGTFRDNLDPTNRYNDTEIKQVLNQCNLLEMLELKGGLDSKVTNENLSVGEKQLLCICRAFLKKSKIILVDQATANIDVKNDQLIQKVIAQKFKNSTVLTIAHRLTTLKDCNKILVLGQGKVLEWGSSIELLGSDSIYRKMCESNDKSYLL